MPTHAMKLHEWGTRLVSQVYVWATRHDDEGVEFVATFGSVVAVGLRRRGQRWWEFGRDGVGCKFPLVAKKVTGRDARVGIAMRRF